MVMSINNTTQATEIMTNITGSTTWNSEQHGIHK